MKISLISVLALLSIHIACANPQHTHTQEQPPWDTNSQAVYDLLIAQMQHADSNFAGSVDTLVTFAQQQKDSQLSTKAYQALMQTQRYDRAVDFMSEWETYEHQEHLAPFTALAQTMNNDIDAALETITTTISSSRSYQKWHHDSLPEAALLSSALKPFIHILATHWFAPQVQTIIQRLYERYPTILIVKNAYIEQLRWNGDADGAAEIVGHELTTKPQNIQIIAAKAGIYRYNGELVKAHRVWQQAIDAYPNDDDMRLAYINFLNNCYDYISAEKQLAVITDPQFASTVTKLKIANAIQQGLIEKAETIFLNDTDEQADYGLQYYFAYTLLQHHYYELADTYLRPLFQPNAASEVPYTVALSAIIAQSYIIYASKDIDAITQGDEWLQSVQDEYHLTQAQLVREQAHALTAAGHKQQALIRLNEFLKLNPNDADVRYTRALLNAEMGNSEQSIQDLRILNAIHPADVDVQNALGYTLLDSPDHREEAALLITKALFEHPRNPAIVDSMGWLHYKNGAYSAALPFLRYSYTHHVDGEIAGHLIMALYNAKHYEQAYAIYLLESTNKEHADKIHTIISPQMLEQLKNSQTTVPTVNTHAPNNEH